MNKYMIVLYRYFIGIYDKFIIWEWYFITICSVNLYIYCGQFRKTLWVMKDGKFIDLGIKLQPVNQIFANIGFVFLKYAYLFLCV